MSCVSELLASKEDGHVYCIKHTATALDAAMAMNDRHIGCLVVVDGGHPVGIVTERDLLRRVMARELKASETPVFQIMTTQFLRCDPKADVDEACRVMGDINVKHLPVIDEHDECVGVISTHDVEKWVCNMQGRELEYMNDYIRGRC